MVCRLLLFCLAASGGSAVRDVLEQVRAALGGAAALQSVHSLSAAGDFRSGPGSPQARGDVDLELLLPDKLLKTRKWSPVEGLKVTTTEAVDENRVWTDSKEKDSRPLPGGGPLGGVPRSGGMGRAGGRRSPGAGTGGGASGTGLAPSLIDTGDDRQVALDFSCLAIGLLLHWPDSAKVELGPEGEDDAGAEADYLSIELGDGAAIRLGIDRKTRRPLTASYQTGAGQTETTQIYFSEYREVPLKGGSLWLPHEISKTRGGQTVEDMHIKKYQLNPHLSPKQFERQEKK